MTTENTTTPGVSTAASSWDTETSGWDTKAPDTDQEGSGWGTETVNEDDPPPRINCTVNNPASGGIHSIVELLKDDGELCEVRLRRDFSESDRGTGYGPIRASISIHMTEKDTWWHGPEVAEEDTRVEDAEMGVNTGTDLPETNVCERVGQVVDRAFSAAIMALKRTESDATGSINLTEFKRGFERNWWGTEEIPDQVLSRLDTGHLTAVDQKTGLHLPEPEPWSVADSRRRGVWMEPLSWSPSTSSAYQRPGEPVRGSWSSREPRGS